MHYNLISIGLGLLAWTIPIIYLMVGKRRDIFCYSSLTACALSLYFQLREVMRRVDLGDFSAIEDTINAVVFAATVLLIATLALNAIAFLRKEK